MCSVSHCEAKINNIQATLCNDIKKAIIMGDCNRGEDVNLVSILFKPKPHRHWNMLYKLIHHDCKFVVKHLSDEICLTGNIPSRTEVRRDHFRVEPGVSPGPSMAILLAPSCCNLSSVFFFW
jgi:hypothetical protein